MIVYQIALSAERKTITYDGFEMSPMMVLKGYSNTTDNTIINMAVANAIAAAIPASILACSGSLFALLAAIAAITPIPSNTVIDIISDNTTPIILITSQKFCVLSSPSYFVLLSLTTM